MTGETVSGDLDAQASIVLTIGVHPPPEVKKTDLRELEIQRT
jgi:hypothetical protein